jgi:hypothetical protein
MTAEKKGQWLHSRRELSWRIANSREVMTTLQSVLKLVYLWYKHRPWNRRSEQEDVFGLVRPPNSMIERGRGSSLALRRARSISSLWFQWHEPSDTTLMYISSFLFRFTFMSPRKKSNASRQDWDPNSLSQLHTANNNFTSFQDSCIFKIKVSTKVKAPVGELLSCNYISDSHWLPTIFLGH